MKDIVVIYHGDCPDGFGGAWAAWKKFGDEADYIGVHYDLPPPQGLSGKEVYIIDFTYSEEITKELIKNNKRVTSIDHHVTSEKTIKLTKDYSYAIDNSGSVLAWRYFHAGQSVPLLLQYVEDGDLWRFNLPDAVSITTYIDSCDYDFNIWNKLAKEIEDNRKIKDFIEKGSFMVNYKNEIVKRIIEENKKMVIFEEYSSFVVNAPHEFASIIGKFLYTKHPPLSISWTEDKDGVHVSLRSNGEVDVGKLAEKFGGGGHKSSAGFRLPSIIQFPWKKI